MSSKQKADLVKKEISKTLDINTNEPLMMELGKFSTCLITYDDENSREIVVPHSLLESDKLISYEIEVEFHRHPNNIMETKKCLIFGKEMDLTKEERKFTSDLVDNVNLVLQDDRKIE